MFSCRISGDSEEKRDTIAWEFWPPQSLLPVTWTQIFVHFIESWIIWHSTFLLTCQGKALKVRVDIVYESLWV